jgi:hypothetical protein
MASFLILEKYHVSQRWAVTTSEPGLTATTLVKGLRDGKYTLDATNHIIQEGSTTVAQISLELEARSDISFHTD